MSCVMDDMQPEAKKRSSCRGHSISLREKVLLIRERETKGTALRTLAAQFGIGKTQVFEILQRKDDILSTFSNTKQDERRSQVKKRLPEINSLVLQYVNESRANHVQLTGLSIRQKARDIALSCGIEDFKASNTWLTTFNRKYRTHLEYETVKLDGDMFLRATPDNLSCNSDEKDTENCDDLVLLASSSVQVEMNGERRRSPCVADCSSSGNLSSASDHLFEQQDICDISQSRSPSICGNGRTDNFSPIPNIYRPTPSRKRILEEDEAVASSEQSVYFPVKSTVTFADVGGCDDALREISVFVSLAMNRKFYGISTVTPSRGLIVHGPPGTGKSLIVQAIAGEYNLPLLKLHAGQIRLVDLKQLLSKTKATAPCILFLDGIEEYGSNEGFLADLVDFLDDLDASVPVIVIASSHCPSLVDPSLKRAGRLDKDVGLGIPTSSSRAKILQVLLRSFHVERNFDIERVSAGTSGFVGADLAALVREVIAANVRLKASASNGRNSSGETASKKLLYDISQPVILRTEDFLEALGHIQPSALREGFITGSRTTWNQIGALSHIKQELRSLIIDPIRNPARYENLGLSPSGAILICGPPGCGKSLIAKAVAKEAGANLIAVEESLLRSQITKEFTQKSTVVHHLFARARNSRPCVVFLGELESLSSSKIHTEVSSYLLHLLLTELGAVDSRDGLYIIAECRRIDLIDPALLERSRFDKVLYVGFPSAAERVDILTAVTENGTKPMLGNDVSLLKIGMLSQLDGYTGADLAALVKEAAMQAVNENPQLSKPSHLQICQRHFEAALRNLGPSVGEQDRKLYALQGSSQ